MNRRSFLSLAPKALIAVPLVGAVGVVDETPYILNDEALHEAVLAEFFKQMEIQAVKDARAEYDRIFRGDYTPGTGHVDGIIKLMAKDHG